MDLYTVSKLLGHSNINTTTIYLRSINVDLDSVGNQNA
jgi:Site-specific recombinase XerD